MKYLKILPLSLVASLLSQDAMALREGTIQQARVEENRQRVEGAQNVTLAGLGLAQNANHRAALTALGAGGVGVNANNVTAADEIIRNAGGAGQVNANNVAASVALLAGVVGVNANNVAAADEIIRNAGGAGQVNANNVAAADALLGGGVGVNANNVAAADALLRTAVGAPLAVNANNVAAADALLTAGLAAAALTNPQLLAVIGANAVNANTRVAVAWAISNGFGGQAAGTVPAGIIQRQGPLVNHPGDVVMRVTWLNAAPIVVGNLVGGAVPDIDVGDNITVHTVNLGGGNIDGGTRVVFTGINQDNVAPAKRIPVNMALVP